MNIVKKIDKVECQEILVTNLTGSRMNEHKHTAFVGSVGDGPHGLYLICHTCMVLATNPTRTWSAGMASVLRFCDVHIEEVTL